MGGKCCTDRKPDGSAPQQDDAKAQGRKTAASIILKVPENSGVRPSQLLGVQGEDAEKFDEAFATMDIQAFVQLLSSQNKLGEGQLEEVPEHPWADLPNSVGALAATQLAVIASMDESNVVTIRQAGAIDVLVGFMKPGVSTDKRDAAVVLLVFMTSVDPDGASASEAGQKGVLPDLLRVLGDSSAPRGLRAAVSTILVNILLEHQGTASRFIREDGAKQLMKACDSTGCTPGDLIFFVEIVENLIELTETEEGGEASKFLPSIRKTVEKNPNMLKSLHKKYPGTELETNVHRLMEQIG